MSTTTPKLGLKKPAGTDNVSPDDFNYNSDLLDNIMNIVHPVGEIMAFAIDTDPNDIYPGTRWQQIQDVFLIGAGNKYTLGAIGGAETVTLTTEQIPSHNHTLKIQGNTAEQWQTSTKLATGTNSEITSYGTGKGGVSISNTGGGQAHNNMPPYKAVYYWQRMA